MSATRDKTQKITFVYSNLYSIYRKGLERAREGATQEASSGAPSLSSQALGHLATGRGLATGVVLKADSARARGVATPPPPPAPRVASYTPAELIGRRVAKPAAAVAKDAGEARGEAGLKAVPAVASVPAAPEESPIESLKQNLAQLNDLQARLRFMLKELEDLIK